MDIKTNTPPFTSEVRDKVPIAIIDDEVFAYETLLRDHSYNIKLFNDIDDVRNLEAFPIILCDIKGVGKRFQSKYEGAHLIKEIKSYYPYKIIYAYTAHQLDASFNKYFQIADQTLKKDIDLEEWIKYLDEALKMVIDPSFLWSRLRKRLLKEDISICDVMKLEDQFVSFIKQKKPEFPDKTYSTNLPDKAKILLTGFAETIKLFKSVL